MMSETMKVRRVERLHTCMAFGWGVMRCNIKTWILIILLMFIPARFFGFSLVSSASLAVALVNRLMRTPGTGNSLHILPMSFTEKARVFWVESVFFVPMTWFVVQVIERICIGGYYTCPILFLAQLTLATMGLASLCHLPFIYPFFIAVNSPYTKNLKELNPIFWACFYGLVLHDESRRIEIWFHSPSIWLVLALAVGVTVFAYVLPKRIIRSGKRGVRSPRPEISQARLSGGLPLSASSFGALGVSVRACCLISSFFAFGLVFLLYTYNPEVKRDIFSSSIISFVFPGVAGIYLMNTWGKTIRALRALPFDPNRLVRFYIMLIAPAACLLLFCALSAYAFGLTMVLPFIKYIVSYILWIPLLYSLSLRFVKAGAPLVSISVFACFFVPSFVFSPLSIMLWALIGIVGWLYLRYSLINNSVIYRSPANL